MRFEQDDGPTLGVEAMASRLDVEESVDLVLAEALVVEDSSDTVVL